MRKKRETEIEIKKDSGILGMDGRIYWTCPSCLNDLNSLTDLAQGCKGAEQFKCPECGSITEVEFDITKDYFRKY